MNKGVRTLICIIAIVLIMIAERGVPVKLQKYDYLHYGIIYVGFLLITDCW